MPHDRAVTRRDFVNGAAAGAGIALLSQSAPALASRALARGSAPGAKALAFDGTPGSGDYARSRGNIWNVVQAAHATRDGEFASLANVEETGETYDVVVVGGGFSGMGAAYKMFKETRRKKSCLVLENHPLWGGEASATRSWWTVCG